MNKHLHAAAAWLCAISTRRPPASRRSGVAAIILSGTVFLAAVAGWAPAAAWAFIESYETLLYSFPKSAANPATVGPSSLVLGSDGSLYGTTRYIGTHDAGSFFKYTPGTGSSGAFATLYSFGDSATDGKHPAGGLLLGSDGNFYGTTLDGGAYGYGTVYQLSPDGVEIILHSFGSSSADGRTPNGRLIQGSDGTIYGSTSAGGPNASNGVGGSVFKIVSGTRYIVYGFSDGGITGTTPLGDVLLSDTHHLWGTASQGGDSGNGTFFRITDTGAANPPITSYSFEASGPTPTGITPKYSLVDGGNDVFYGIATAGGTYGGSAIFKYSNGIDGAPPLGLLYSFGNALNEGKQVTSLMKDADGFLYGTTYDGGIYASSTDAGGTLFRLSTSGVKTALLSFGASVTEYSVPVSTVYSLRKHRLTSLPTALPSSSTAPPTAAAPVALAPSTRSTSDRRSHRPIWWRQSTVPRTTDHPPMA